MTAHDFHPLLALGLFSDDALKRSLSASSGGWGPSECDPHRGPNQEQVAGSGAYSPIFQVRDGLKPLYAGHRVDKHCLSSR